jgi:hypothetical protein
MLVTFSGSGTPSRICVGPVPVKNLTALFRVLAITTGDTAGFVIDPSLSPSFSHHVPAIVPATPRSALLQDAGNVRGNGPHRG